MTFFDKHAEALTKIATLLTRLFSIAYFFGAACMAVALVLALIIPPAPGGLIWGAQPVEELSSGGFSIAISDGQGAPLPSALPVFFVEAALSLILMAMVFRNAHLILRTAQGKTKSSKGRTPFQKDNVRLLREIGLFFIGITVVQMAFCGIAVAMLGPENAEVSAGAENLVTGVLMLCLAQCFALGERMQQDVDGLV